MRLMRRGEEREVGQKRHVVGVDVVAFDGAFGEDVEFGVDHVVFGAAAVEGGVEAGGFSDVEREHIRHQHVGGGVGVRLIAAVESQDVRHHVVAKERFVFRRNGGVEGVLVFRVNQHGVDGGTAHAVELDEGFHRTFLKHGDVAFGGGFDGAFVAAGQTGGAPDVDGIAALGQHGRGQFVGDDGEVHAGEEIDARIAVLVAVDEGDEVEEERVVARASEDFDAGTVGDEISGDSVVDGAGDARCSLDKGVDRAGFGGLDRADQGEMLRRVGGFAGGFVESDLNHQVFNTVAVLVDLELIQRVRGEDGVEARRRERIHGHGQDNVVVVGVDEGVHVVDVGGGIELQSGGVAVVGAGQHHQQDGKEEHGKRTNEAFVAHGENPFLNSVWFLCARQRLSLTAFLHDCERFSKTGTREEGVWMQILLEIWHAKNERVRVCQYEWMSRLWKAMNYRLK